MIKGKCHCQTVKYESSNDSSVTAKPVVKSMEARLVLVLLSLEKDSKSFQEKTHWWDTNLLQGKNVFFVLIVELTFMRPLQRNLKILYLELVV